MTGGWAAAPFVCVVCVERVGRDGPAACAVGKGTMLWGADASRWLVGVGGEDDRCGGFVAGWPEPPSLASTNRTRIGRSSTCSSAHSTASRLDGSRNFSRWKGHLTATVSDSGLPASSRIGCASLSRPETIELFCLQTFLIIVQRR